MKRSLLVVSSVCAVCTFAFSSPISTSSRESQRLQEGKITKNQAQHLVLKKFPGASIKKCDLTSAKDQSVWVLHVLKPGAQEPAEVKVDGRTGKILP